MPPSEKNGAEDSQRLYLVVVDETPESVVALRFAGLSAKASGARLLLLMILEPTTAFRQWLGVETLMQEEARAEARRVLRRSAREVESYAGVRARVDLREGDKMEELSRQINKDQKVTTLVLGAAAQGENPGPLVSHMMSGGFGVPVIIVPGDLSPRQIRAHI